jgi:methyltransferase (TIGR00027 family)
MSRAAHQILDNPKILEDPVALRILGVEDVRELLSAPERFQTALARYLRAFVVARSRIAEDALSEAVARGVRQYVILGAGLDTFAYRNPYPSSILSVFEVDHPATQEWKLSKLSAAQISAPESLTFVPSDFETHVLGDRLQEFGFRMDEPSFFSWLGVTMYVTRSAVMTTMRYVASSVRRGSGIVFDYAHPTSSSSRLKDRAAAVGEPWQTFFEPGELALELKALGFERLDDNGPEEINVRFFRTRADGLRVGGQGRLMIANT